MGKIFCTSKKNHSTYEKQELSLNGERYKHLLEGLEWADLLLDHLDLLLAKKGIA